MTRGEIWKDFFKRTVLPAVIALFLFFMFKNVFTEDGQVRVEFMNDYSLLTPETSNFSKQKWWSSPPAEPGGEVKEEGSGL